MRTLTHLVGTMIDGYIAGPADEIDSFSLGADLLGPLGTHLPETLPTHVRAQLGIDAPNARFDAGVPVVAGDHGPQPFAPVERQESGGTVVTTYRRA